MRILAFGIDLGTSNSCIAVARPETSNETYLEIEIIRIKDSGSNVLPSMVAFAGSERLVGMPAKNQSQIDPANTIYGVKRLMGRNFDDEEVQYQKKNVPFEIIDVGGKPEVRVNFKGSPKTYKPQEISMLILETLKKEAAKAFPNYVVSNPVITCPAYFSERPRQATLEAAKLAGFCLRCHGVSPNCTGGNCQPVCLLNEPTAAALSFFSSGQLSDKLKVTVMVFDFGGGTLDISLLEIYKGDFSQVKVIATAGDNQLGGGDLTIALAKYLIEQFNSVSENENNRLGTFESLDANQKACLLNVAEKAKIALSYFNGEDEFFEYTQPSFHAGKNLVIKLNQRIFVRKCKGLLRRITPPMEKVIADAKIQKEEIYKVIMVGGSSRIPEVRRVVENFIGQPDKILFDDLQADEAIARGAAIYSMIGKKILTDVTPFSLGVELCDGSMSAILPRNTPIPYSEKKPYTTVSDRQTKVLIRVFQGESPVAKQNVFLDEFELSGITPLPAGKAKLEVEFTLNLNGMVLVTARDLDNPIVTKTVPVKRKDPGMSHEEIQRARQREANDAVPSTPMQSRDFGMVF